MPNRESNKKLTEQEISFIIGLLESAKCNIYFSGGLEYEEKLKFCDDVIKKISKIKIIIN